jgi:PAS domain S-box-containing protein
LTLLQNIQIIPISSPKISKPCFSTALFSPENVVLRPIGVPTLSLSFLISIAWRGPTRSPLSSCGLVKAHIQYRWYQHTGLFCFNGNLEDFLMPRKPTYEDLKESVKELRKEVAKHKRLEEAFRASENEWHSLVDNAPNIICIVDRKGIIRYVNHTVPGLEVESALGTSHYDYAPREYQKLMKESIRKVFKTGKPANYEIPGVGPNGTTSWYMSQLWPLKRDTKVVAVTIMPSDITQQKQAEEALREREAALETRTGELEEVNSALRVLMNRKEEDKKELEENVSSNVKGLVAPYAEKLRKSGLGAKQMAYLNMLESNLNDITSPFTRELSSKYSRLTPAEIQIAHLVKDGKTTNQIAKLLNLSLRTIESHRQNIRMKIGAKNKKANLRSLLLSMEER